MQIYNHKNKILFMFSVIVIILLINTQTVFGALKHITDDVDLFNSNQEIELNSLINEIKSEYGVDVFILTRSSIVGTRERYMDSYVASNSDYINDAVLILINMDSNNRGVQLQGYGACSTIINNTRIESILDEIVPYLSNASYYKAMQVYIEQVEKYVKKGEPSNFSLALETLPHAQNFIIALVISAIIVGIIIYKSEGHDTTNFATYSQNRNILGKQDRYTHTTTTRVRKPEPSSSGGGSRGGGGGGGGRSSGGRSF